MWYSVHAYIDRRDVSWSEARIEDVFNRLWLKYDI